MEVGEGRKEALCLGVPARAILPPEAPVLDSKTHPLISAIRIPSVSLPQCLGSWDRGHSALSPHPQKQF